MAVKFSQFNIAAATSDIDYVVGYKSTDNVQIPIGLLSKSYQISTAQSGLNEVLNLTGSDGSIDTITFTAGANITLTDDGAGNGFTIQSKGNVEGAGSVNTISKWSATDTLTDSIMSETAAGGQFTDLYITFAGAGGGISTQNLEIGGFLLDSNGQKGTAGQILSSTGTLTDWITPEAYDLNSTTDGVNVDLNLTSASGTDNSSVKLVPTGGITISQVGNVVTLDTSALGTISDITAASPLTGGGSTGTVNIGIQQSSAAQDGYLSSTDWTTFNNKVSTDSAQALTSAADALTLVSNDLTLTRGDSTTDVVDLSAYQPNNLDIATYGSDLTGEIITVADELIVLDVSTNTKGRMNISQLAPALNGTGLDASLGSLRISSTAAGDGLSGGSGVPLAVNVDNSSIEISGDELTIKTGGITNAKLANSSITINATSVSLGGSISVGTVTEVSSTNTNTLTVSDPTGAAQITAVTGSVTNVSNKLARGQDIYNFTTGLTVNDLTDPTANFDVNNNKIINLTTPTLANDAANKSYVDNVLAGSGALIYQGAYNATQTPPSAGVMQGWTYAVTVAGNAGGFWSPSLNIGDLIIANVNTPTSITEWTEVQANIDVATAGTSVTSIKGIAGFNEDDFTAVNGFVSVKDGAYVTGSGTANQVTLWDSNSNITSDSGLTFDTAGNHLTIGGDLNVLGGDIVLSGTGRIQGIDTVSITNGTDAANKTYVDTLVAGTPQGTVVSITAGTGLSSTPSPITATGTINIANNGVGATQLNVSGNGGITEFLRSDSDGSFTWAVPPGITNLSKSATTSNVTINSSTGSNIAIGAATASVAGVMTTTLYNNVQTNNGKSTNVTTNLGYTTAATTGTVTSSDGTNATLPAATTSLAGLMTGTDKTKLNGIATGATNVTSNSQIANGANYTTNTGTVTSIVAGTGLNGGTITGSGTISIANGGVDTAQLATDSVVYSRIGPEFSNTDGSTSTSLNFASYAVFTRASNAGSYSISSSQPGMVKQLIISSGGSTSFSLTGVTSNLIAGSYDNTKTNFIQIAVQSTGIVWFSISQV